MEQFIQEQLGKLKKLKAREGCFEHSLTAILRTEQEQHSPVFSTFSLKMSIGFATAVFAAFVVLIGVSQQIPGGSGAVASLDDESLQGEVSSVDFQIHVREAHYFSQSADRVASALDEIAKEE